MKLYTFILKEIFIWSFVWLALASLLVVHLASNFLHLYFIGIAGISFLAIVFYILRLLKCFIWGKLVSVFPLKMHLPINNYKALNFKLPKHEKACTIIYLKNTKLSKMYGEIQLKNSFTGDEIARLDLKKAKGIEVKNIRGKKQIIKGRESNRQDKLAILSCNGSQDIDLFLTLDWNYIGWNSRWEDSIPADKNLDIEVYVRIA